MKWRQKLGWGVMALVILPILLSCATMIEGRGDNWRAARRDSSGQAPPAATTQQAVIQVYVARTVGMRGALGVHSWIAVKPTGAASFTRYEVIGWGVENGQPAVRVNRSGPDNYWFGARPEKLVDLRGPQVDALIARVEQAVRDYPYPSTYRTWPGPNSNTFIAYIARRVPELRLDLPPTAIGKDYLPGGALFATSPSGTGAQISLFGLLGVMAALEEGVEINILGLTLGLDIKSPALKLPAVGRVGFAQ